MHIPCGWLVDNYIVTICVFVKLHIIVIVVHTINTLL